MEHSESIKNIATALHAFQKDAPAVTKDAKANYGKYATLGNVIDSTRDALAKNGLSFMQMPDGTGLTTLVMHTSGEWVKATGQLTLDKQTAQGLGSALTRFNSSSVRVRVRLPPFGMGIPARGLF